MTKRGAPARAAVRKFLEALVAEDWEEAVQHAQISWAIGAAGASAPRIDPEALPPSPAEFLSSKLESLGITSFRVRDAHRLKHVNGGPSVPGAKNGTYSSVMMDVDVDLETKRCGPISAQIRVIREDLRGRPCTNGAGRWGANPASMFRMKVRPTEPAG